MTSRSVAESTPAQQQPTNKHSSRWLQSKSANCLSKATLVFVNAGAAEAYIETKDRKVVTNVVDEKPPQATPRKKHRLETHLTLPTEHWHSVKVSLTEHGLINCILRCNTSTTDGRWILANGSTLQRDLHMKITHA